MKKLIVSLSAVAALSAVLLTATQTRGQAGNAQAGSARTARPHQIGLIDMAYVFNNYEKFKALQEGIRAGLKGTQDEAQKIIEQMKAQGERIKSGEIKKDSPEYRDIEAKLISAQAQLEAMGKVAQADNLRKEAEIYRQVYLEVQDTIRIYADHYGYTLIIRFDRESVADASDPQQVLQRLTRQVVYHRGEDDLTMVILNQLNRQYQSSGGRPASTATGPAAGSTR
ncbi:MAG: OmpH family outer membrane protein [Planctomycetaceae bacterium]